MDNVMTVEGLDEKDALKLAEIFVKRSSKITIELVAEGLLQKYYKVTVEVNGKEKEDGHTD